MLFGREPALWVGFIGAVIALAVGFGLNWTGQQVSLTMAAVIALLALLTRSQSTPAKPATVDDLQTYIKSAPPEVIDKAGVQIIQTTKTLALIGALLGLALLASPAGAVGGSVFDPGRGALGVNAGAVYYESNDSRVPTELGVRIEPYLSWSLSDQLSAAAKTGFDVRYGRVRTTAELVACVYGFENATNEHRWQAFLAFGRVWHRGNGIARFSHPDSWTATVKLSRLLMTHGDRDLLYLKPQVGYDHNNGFDVFLGLGAQY